MKKDLKIFRNELEKEVKNNIIPYWGKAMDRKSGGFIGRIDGWENREPDADKGGVLNARILWTFSAAYRILKEPLYLEIATRAKDYLLTYFYDPEFGGIYWSVDAQGHPRDTKKQIYALGFAVYGLSEYFRATGNREALDKACELFATIEQYSFDAQKNGYFEAFSRTWEELGDVRLSDKDDNDRKTMNTHLHILEPYTNLYRVWKDPVLKKQLYHLIQVFLDKILDTQSGHLNLFFDEDWNCRHRIISYGHDIEASWLLYEAALELGDAELTERVEKVSRQIADAAAEGLLPDGSMMYEYDLDREHRDLDRHWWVQAETVVGYFNAWQFSGETKDLQRALDTWKYIQNHLIDRINGEWFWSVRADGSINREDDKIGPWKCPYHNSRMCLELIERIDSVF